MNCLVEIKNNLRIIQKLIIKIIYIQITIKNQNMEVTNPNMEIIQSLIINNHLCVNQEERKVSVEHKKHFITDEP